MKEKLVYIASSEKDDYMQIIKSIKRNMNPARNTVMIVDDEKGIRMKIAREVKAFDPSMVIFEATNGAEALETLDFIRVFGLLWQRLPPDSSPPLAVGVTLFHLTAAHNATLPLLRPEISGLAKTLDEAVDRLNQCYGKNTVYFGGAQSALESAPARIAFTHIPEVEKERD